MLLDEMWNIFKATGKIEAYLYYRYSRKKCKSKNRDNKDKVVSGI